MKKLLLLFFLLFYFSIINSQTIHWGKNIGGDLGVDIADAKIDKNGNEYIVGSFRGATDFDPGVDSTILIPGGASTVSDVFVVKYDSIGNFAWAFNFGGFSDNGAGISIDTSGNIIILGYFEGTADFDPSVGVFNMVAGGSGNGDIFITKYNPLGQLLWAKSFGGTTANSEVPGKVTTDSNNNIFITGKFKSTIDFDPSPSVSNYTAIGFEDIFFSKFDFDGNYIWTKVIGSSGTDEPRAINIDNNNNFYLTGRTSNADFDPSGNTAYINPAGTFNNLFFAKYDNNGNYIWAKQLVHNSGPLSNYISEIILDDLNNVYLTGGFIHTTDFDPSPQTSYLVSSDVSGFIAKYDSLGAYLWSKKIGENTGGGSIAVDPSGRVYAFGLFRGTNDFNPNVPFDSVYTSIDPYGDFFIAKYDTNGQNIWAKTLEGDATTKIFIDNSNSILLVGLINDTTDLDVSDSTYFLYPKGALGYSNLFIAKYSRNVCENFHIQVNAYSDIDCMASGLLNVSALGGATPYLYTWNTSPVITDSIAVFSSPGFYNLSIVDSNSCVLNFTPLVNGPLSNSGYDLNVNLIDSPLRVGFNSSFNLNYLNNGCIPISGNLKIVLDTLVNYLNALPIPDNIIGDTLVWNYTNLTYGSLHVTPQIIVHTPAWANIGDTVCFKTIISPLAGDIDTTNNIKQYCFPVINGYDPNDKKVYPQGLCAEGFVENNQLLTYTVRFQNTGNASAININVVDTLDPDLNLNTVRVIGSSHLVVAEVLTSNVLNFRFNNINLADSTSNEAASHGYVIFEVLPNTGLSNETAITNNVGIYFDYNPPVYTNTVLNTISDGTINTNVSAIGNTITASLSGVSYQWLNCDNGNSAIAGATNPSYTAIASGNYSVIINDGCFVDTSACVSIFVTGISEVENSNQFSIYPNPSNNTITITTKEPTQIKIINMLGEVVLEKQIQNNVVVDINNLSNGIYFIQTKEGYSTKLIKN